jgi:hypothetical protein
MISYIFRSNFVRFNFWTAVAFQRSLKAIERAKAQLPHCACKQKKEARRGAR